MIMGMGGCSTCKKMSGWTWLVVGLLFLLQDRGVWGFFGLKWWTVLFLLVGLGAVASSCCKDCQACGTVEAPKKRR